MTYLAHYTSIDLIKYFVENANIKLGEIYDTLNKENQNQHNTNNSHPFWSFITSPHQSLLNTTSIVDYFISFNYTTYSKITLFQY